MLNQVKLMSRYANKQFSINDLNTDPMTLTLKLYLDTVKMYYHTKNEVSLQKLALTDTWTHTDTHTHTHTHALQKHCLYNIRGRYCHQCQYSLKYQGCLVIVSIVQPLCSQDLL